MASAFHLMSHIQHALDFLRGRRDDVRVPEAFPPARASGSSIEATGRVARLLHRHRRPKVLLVIEQCNPEWPSVPLVGYKFYAHIARHADVTLVTHRRNEAALRKLHPLDAIEFIDEPGYLTRWHAVAEHLSRVHGAIIWPIYHTLAYPVYASFNRRVARRMGPRVRAGEFECVHALTPMIPRYPYAIARYCDGVPFVIGPVNGGVPYPEGFHDIEKLEYAHLNVLRRVGAVLLPHYKQTYRLADHLYAGSSYTRDLLIEMFHPGCEVEILPENGLEAESFSLPDLKAGRPVMQILFVGRLVPYKGADITLDALAAMEPDLRRQCRLTVVGDGPEMPLLRRKVVDLGLQSLVNFTGWVPQAKTVEYYRDADVFCFPSIREFGGAVALEAMACSLPCVIVDHAGLSEYVTPEAGFKIAPHSREQLVDAVASALSTLLLNPEMRRTMSEAAFQRARHYLWDHKARQIVRKYRQLMERARPVQS
jgi:glycosyltransferase involved in cell wall biosynthesis